MKFWQAEYRLYRRISLLLLLLLLAVGGVYVLLSAYTAQRYFQEVTQRLHGSLAGYLVSETRPQVGSQPDTAATHEIMHAMMIINRSVEVYLLDTAGRITDYVVPYHSVKLGHVDLRPVKDFIASGGKRFVLGDNPRAPGQRQVFSAAPIHGEDSALTGYAYIILAGEAHASAASAWMESHMLRAGGGVFFSALLLALGLGLVAVGGMMRSIHQLVLTVRQYQEGNLHARIPTEGLGEFTLLGRTLNEMAGRIAAQIEQIHSVERLRRELVAHVSHDLRTPLSIMQGYIETLLIKDGQLPPADRGRYLQIVLESAEKLSRLVQQLFEYAQLESKDISPSQEAFFAQELAQDLMTRYRVLAQERGIELALEAPQHLPLVFADISLMERVLQNLLDNALKFTPPGGWVRLSLRETRTGIEIRVADSGQGIGETEQTHIFERYWQGPTSSGKGAGLGLAIVKKILEIHNAAIHVQSAPGQGASFCFQLPLFQGT